MKILLIYPYCLENRLHSEDTSVVPIGLYYVGAFLKANDYDVEILNWHNINKRPEGIKEKIMESKPGVIGFSILHANRWGGIEIAHIAKQVDPKVKIIFGGIGATFLWEHFLTHFNEVDFVVIGEGEYAFLELIKCANKETYEDIENIKGIAFRKKGEVIKTEDSKAIEDLDKLPIPAKYFKFHHVSSSRGCPHSCAFCGSSQFWGPKVRFHSPEYFVNQLELLYKKGVIFFYFSDDTFTMKKNRVIEICKKIVMKKLKITWVAISRVDYVNEEILYWMRKAGCVQISYGVESGSDEIRNLVLNKNINTEQIKKAFALTKEYGILARAYYIYGSPGETWETIQESIDLICDTKPLSIIFYILDIFPGTKLYADFKQRSNLTDEVWLRQIEDIMYFETNPDMSQEMVLAFGEKLRTEYYRNLPRFVGSIELIDKSEFYEMHADFYSRLAMTFSHGDYAGIEAIREKEEIAERLYKKALDYHSDHRAYLGLGIIKQKNGTYEESIAILLEGLRYFPQSEQLNICLGISYMNSGDYKEALSYFLKFPDSKEASYYIEKIG